MSDLEGVSDLDGVREPDGTLVVEVPPLLAGVRVDRAVAMLANVSRAVATALIASGGVHVDDRAVTVGRSTLREGAILTVALPEPGGVGVEAEAGVQFAVVYADDEVAVVDKPAGLVVHPGAGHQEGTLVGGLLSRFPDLSALVDSGFCPPDRPGIVHRLDKGTSGLLAVARTEPAYTALVAQLADRSMQRHYLALVEGLVADDRGEIDAPIGRSTRTPTKMAVAAGGGLPGPASPSWSAAPCRARRRWSSSACRAGGHIRSASTWRPSATRWWATPATGRPTAPSATAGSSCTPSAWPSPTPAAASAWSSPRRSRRTSKGT